MSNEGSVKIIIKGKCKNYSLTCLLNKSNNGLVVF